MRPGKACSGKYQTFFGLADNAGFQRSSTNSATCIWAPPMPVAKTGNLYFPAAAMRDSLAERKGAL
jgi:hypothetical protein